MAEKDEHWSDGGNSPYPEPGPDPGPGLVHVITGDGKGKTTAALGLCLRAWGHGMKVRVVQFMKGDIEYGELKAARKLDGFTIEQYGRPTFVNPDDPDPVDVKRAEDGLARARELLKDPDLSVLVLDEVNVAASWNLIKAEDVAEAVRNRRDGLEVILTGRGAPDEFREMADYISEVKEVRHPYQKGVQAREGVEH